MFNSTFLFLTIGGILLFIISLIYSANKKRKEKTHDIQTNRVNPTRVQKKQKGADKPIHNYNRYIQTLPTVKIGKILDGDTVDVFYNTSKIRIRLSAIDCPEDGQEWGDKATFGLIKLIGGKKHVKLQTHGQDKYGRTVGTLYVFSDEKKEWINVNEKMVTFGHAWVLRAYYTHLPIEQQKRLDRLEKWARSKRIGLWKQNNPLPPWLWRQYKAQECPQTV